MGEVLEKALMDSSTNTNAYASRTDLHPMIYDILKDELPLWQIVGTEKAQGPVHQYRVRASLPEAWAEGELSSANYQSPTHTVRNVPLKIVRSWGGTSAFMQKTTERWINSLQESIETSVEGLANTLEFFMLYGDKDADSYQFDGVSSELQGDSTAKTELTSGGNIYNINAAFTLTHFDKMIDRAKSYRGGSSDAHVLVASRDMISRISGLQTRITRDVQMVEHEGGFVMTSYRGVPILPSDILSPASTTTSPAITATKHAGGSLADDEWFYTMSSVTLTGEQKPNTTTNSATTETTNNSNTLTWTADSTAKLYYIWRGITNVVADMRLLSVVAAKTYDSVGNLSTDATTWTDEGTLTPNTAIAPTDAGENMFLINVDKGERGMKMLGAVSPLGDPIDEFFTYTPLATTNSAFRFMIEGFIAAKIPYPASVVQARRAKLA